MIMELMLSTKPLVERYRLLQPRKKDVNAGKYYLLLKLYRTLQRETNGSLYKCFGKWLILSEDNAANNLKIHIKPIT